MKRSSFRKKTPDEIKQAILKKKAKMARSTSKGVKSSKKGKNGRLATSSKGKPKSIAKLKKELWVVFSKWVRQRDKYTCVTCGKKGEGSGIHAGHYITKAVGGLALYFHEKNVHAQCYRCNIHLSGNWTAYRDFILQTYGEETEKELMLLKGKVCKWTEYDYQKKTEEYKQLLELPTG